MAAKRHTGDGDPYSDAEEAALCDAIEAAMADDYDDQPGPTSAEIQVTAEIEWAGTIDRSGVRSTSLDDVNLRPVIEAVQRLKAAEGRDRGPLRSYRAKGWQAQLRQLGRVRRGPAAMAVAALTPSRETMRRWASGQQKPSRANREKIGRAYDELRNPGRQPITQARHEVAEKFTEALRDRYGSNVRLRDIRDFRIR
jgi:hypothetical protein